MMEKYTVIYKDHEENEYRFDIMAMSPADASDACYAENSSEVVGYKEAGVVEL